jgi:hypothetical protein
MTTSDPFGPIDARQQVIDAHAFDSQVGKVVNLRVGDEVVGRARLVAVSADSVGLVFTLETLRPGDLADVQVPIRTSVVMSEQEPAPPPVPEHEHRWRQVEVNGNDYRTFLPGNSRPPMPQMGLVCDGPGSCPVIDDVERDPWAGLPLNLVFEGDPRE